jgi:prepilin-type processing-associated H-X9-DG protein
MKSQRLKDLYLTAILPATVTSHAVWKIRLGRAIPQSLRRGPHGQVWLNLGSGAKPHPEFVNIDGNVFRGPDMWLDLRRGLPFPSETVDCIYASHVLEHLYWRELLGILRESFRVLKTDGWMRVLVPSLELAVAAYVNSEMGWFSDFPTRFESLGGKFSNFLFCDGQHRLGFDFSLMEEALRGAGFSSIQQMKPRTSHCLTAAVLTDCEPSVGHIETSLVVEARKWGFASMTQGG